jgi:hypothetical protein
MYAGIWLKLRRAESEMISMLQLYPDGNFAFARRKDVGQLDELTTLSDEKYAVTLRDSTTCAIFTGVSKVLDLVTENLRYAA